MEVDTFISSVLRGGYLNPGGTTFACHPDDSTVALCTLRATTVLSRNCCTDFGCPSTKKVVSHSRDDPGVTAPLQTNIVPLTAVWKDPPFRYPRPFKVAEKKYNLERHS